MPYFSNKQKSNIVILSTSQLNTSIILRMRFDVATVRGPINGRLVYKLAGLFFSNNELSLSSKIHFS